MGLLNPLIVTDKGTRDLPFISKLQSYLADDLSTCSRKPRQIMMMKSELVVKIRSGNHDSIIAIESGSAMDGGKAICLTVKNGRDLWDFVEAEPVDISPDQAFPKLLTIP